MRPCSYGGGEHPVWIQITHGLHYTPQPLYRAPIACPIRRLGPRTVARMMPCLYDRSCPPDMKACPMQDHCWRSSVHVTMVGR